MRIRLTYRKLKECYSQAVITPGRRSYKRSNRARKRKSRSPSQIDTDAVHYRRRYRHFYRPQDITIKPRRKDCARDVLSYRR